MGFWGTMGKVGLGLGSMIPGVGPIIGAVGSAIQGNRGGAPKPGFPIDTQTRAGVSPELQDSARFNTGVSQGMLTGAQNNFQGASDYYRSLASGDAATTMQALSPEINQIRSNTGQVVDQINKFGARGGGTALADRTARIGQAGQIASVYGGARKTGAEGLAGLGQSMAGAGYNTGALGQQGLQQAGALDLNTQGMVNQTKLGQARLGQVEAQNTPNFGSVIAEQGGLGNVIKNIPGVMRPDGTSRIPGMDKIAGFFGGNKMEKGQLGPGQMPNGSAPVGTPQSQTFNFGQPMSTPPFLPYNFSGNPEAPSTSLGSQTNAFAGQGSSFAPIAGGKNTYPVMDQYKGAKKFAMGGA